MAYSVQPVRWAERSARAAGPAGEAHGHPAHDPQLERDRHVGFPDADGIKQGRNHRPADRIGGTVTGRPTQVRGQRLAGEIGVQFHDPQVAIGRAVRALEVRRDHADQVTGVVDQGRGLDRAESAAAAISRCGVKPGSARTSPTTVCAPCLAARPQVEWTSSTTAK